MELLLTVVTPAMLFFDSKFYDLFKEETVDSSDLIIKMSMEENLKMRWGREDPDTPPSVTSFKKKKRLGSISGNLESLYTIKPQDLDLKVAQVYGRQQSTTGMAVSVLSTLPSTTTTRSKFER